MSRPLLSWALSNWRWANTRLTSLSAIVSEMTYVETRRRAAATLSASRSWTTVAMGSNWIRSAYFIAGTRVRHRGRSCDRCHHLGHDGQIVRGVSPVLRMTRRGVGQHSRDGSIVRHRAAPRGHHRAASRELLQAAERGLLAVPRR